MTPDAIDHCASMRGLPLTASLQRRPRRLACLLAITAIVALAGCKGGVGNVGADISTSQAVLDLGQNIGDLREENSLLQAQIDSLNGVMAYQDSVLRQLAGLAGVTMRPRPQSYP